MITAVIRTEPEKWWRWRRNCLLSIMCYNSLSCDYISRSVTDRDIIVMILPACVRLQLWWWWWRGWRWFLSADLIHSWTVTWSGFPRTRRASISRWSLAFIALIAGGRDSPDHWSLLRWQTAAFWDIRATSRLRHRRTSRVVTRACVRQRPLPEEKRSNESDENVQKNGAGLHVSLRPQPASLGKWWRQRYEWIVLF